MDSICIKDIAVFGYHGVMKEENVVGQKFLISVDMKLDVTEAGMEDDIEKSVNYASVCEDIKYFAENNTFKLIETLATKVADLILINYPLVNSVSVTVSKPWAPVHIPVDTVSVSVTRKWHELYLSIGSNMGDKKTYLDNAVKGLDEAYGIKVVNVSDYIVTAPVGYVVQDDFLNACIYAKTIHTPEKILEVINGIEQENDRKRDVHWGPRTLDIDIIFYDDVVMNTTKLIIPHKESHKREFVLKPLSQIAPDFIHPVYRKSVNDLYEELCKIGEGVKNEYSDDEFVCIEDLQLSYDTKIVFFGNEGTYSQQAMERFFGRGGYESFAKQKFTDVMEAVQNGDADYGVVPIENSSTGGITDIYDHMLDYDIFIVGEQIIKIEHALLGLPGSSIDDIKGVYSHTQGIRQCGEFLSQYPKIEPIAVSSTAYGAKKVAKDGNKEYAAIASVKAAEVYGLSVLKNCINAQDNNSTRFIILASRKQYIKNASKISISFEAKHESGALYRMLSHFYRNGINLEKIESRPIPNRTWEYRFFADFAGNLAMQNVKNALGGVAEESKRLKVLGNY